MPAQWPSTSSTSATTTWGSWNSTAATTTTTWRVWAATNTSSTTTSSYGNDVWSAWLTDSRGNRYHIQPGQSIVIDNVWYSWNSGESVLTQRAPAPVRQPTAEELEAERERRRLAEERYAEQRKLKEKAEARAEQLLVELLDAEQRLEYAQHKQFHVIAPSGKRYCIKKGVAGNVHQDAWRFCAHASQNLPTADHMLSQKLAIETDEAAFLAVANASPVHR